MLGRAASSTHTRPGCTTDGEGVYDDEEAEVGCGSDAQPKMSSELQDNMLDVVYLSVANATGWKCHHWVNSDLIFEELTGSEDAVVEYLSMWTMLGVMDARELEDGELQVCFISQPRT